MKTDTGRRLRTARAFILILVLGCATVVHAAGGGGSGDDEGDANIDVYLALGAAVLIGAILIFDVFSGPEGGDIEPADITAEEPVIIEDTGVDWESVMTETVPPVIAVSAFPADAAGAGTAALFLEYLDRAGSDELEVYNDPISLGLGSHSEESVLAGEFFGAGYFVAATEAGSGLELQLYSGAEGPLWSYTLAEPADTASIRLAADSLAAYLAD